MDYIPRPGIVSVKLCGQYVLIPSRQASDACKSALPLSMAGLMVWNAIVQDDSMEKLQNLYGVFSSLEPEAQLSKIQEFCQKLLKLGFILPKEQERERDPNSEEDAGA